VSAGFVEVVVDRWKVYAPEHNAERVLLLLEAVAALVKSAREPRTMRGSFGRGYQTTGPTRDPDPSVLARPGMSPSTL
jgi:hypothetical protein